MVGRSSPRRHTIGAIGPARSRSMVGPIAALSDSADGPHTVAIEPGSGVVLDGIDPAAGASRPVAVMFEHGAVDVVHDVCRTQLERHAPPVRHGRETFGVRPALLQPVHLVAPGCGLEDGMDLDHCRAPPPAGQDLSLIHISEPTRLGMISYA